MSENKKDDGGRAFPLYGGGGVNFGMTLRDWFAGQALVGLLGRPCGSMSQLAREAFQVADAMLEERKK